MENNNQIETAVVVPAVPNANNIHVYAKLAKARLEFLMAGAKKSGAHQQLMFDYFELQDIVPVATAIFNEIGLIQIPTFTEDVVYCDVVDTEHPTESIRFQIPARKINVIVSNSGKAVTNEIQTMGSMITYYRRYLWLLILDVVESDTIDANSGNVAKKDEEIGQTESKTTTVAKKETKKTTTKATSKKPKTSEERKEIAQELVAENKEQGVSSDDLDMLKDACSELLAIDSAFENPIQLIVDGTNEFKDLTIETYNELSSVMAEIFEMLNNGVDAAELAEALTQKLSA